MLIVDAAVGGEYCFLVLSVNFKVFQLFCFILDKFYTQNQSYFHFIPEKAVPDWMPAFDRDNHRVSVVNTIWLIHFYMIQEIVSNKSNIHFLASHKVKSRYTEIYI